MKKRKKHVKKLKKEFKKITLTAIVTAFSLVIALAWNSVISEAVAKITALSILQGKLASAIIITIIGVLGIWLFTKILGEKK